MHYQKTVKRYNLELNPKEKRGSKLRAINYIKTFREIHYVRFQRALREKSSLFREFTIRPPYKSTKDIFCLRIDRMMNSYRKISINNLELRVPLRERIQLRIILDKESGLTEVRFWHKG